MLVKKQVRWDLPADELSDEDNEEQDHLAPFGPVRLAAPSAGTDPVLLYLKTRYGTRSDGEALVDSADELDAEVELEARPGLCHLEKFTGRTVCLVDVLQYRDGRLYLLLRWSPGTRVATYLPQQGLGRRAGLG